MLAVTANALFCMPISLWPVNPSGVTNGSGMNANTRDGERCRSACLSLLYSHSVDAR
jgi:hypothetical protein